MHIVVCIKRVPDTAARIEIAGDGVSIDASNVAFAISPYDEFALEEALRLKEAGGGEVTALCLGDAEKELRDALAKGADKAVMLKPDGEGDAFSRAKALAEALEGLAADLVMTGYKAADDDDPQVGPLLATLLGRPCVNECIELAAADGVLSLVRAVDGGQQKVSCPLPAVVTCGKTPNKPRIANIKGIMKAKKKPLEKREVSLGASQTQITQLAPPAERAAGRMVEADGAVAEIVRVIKDELKLV